MDTNGIKDKLMKMFKWDSVLDSLPTIALIAGGILLLDKIIDISGKLEPIYKKVKRWNKDGVFEIIDTIGDNIQILDLILKAVKIDLSGDELDKLADGLQNLGTIGKHVSALWSLIAPKFKNIRTNASDKYKELI